MFIMSMAQKRNTKLRMINSALDLFHRFGVNGTSVDQVLEKSKTGKSQFTHYFKTKEGMVSCVIQYLHEMIQTGQTPTGYDIKSWRDFESWFQKYIDFQESVGCERSCPIGTIGGDLTSENKKARSDVLQFLEWSRGKLKTFFLERKAAGELIPEARPQELADFCISIMQGGMLLNKMRRDTEMFKNSSSLAIKYIRTLRRSGKIDGA
ncbi:MAG: TetR family transcriptional regulator [Candidatus Angelobacter sp.]|nr:TetR family transcriptional regulator [Candidatus Angelobacter sp.]